MGRDDAKRSQSGTTSEPVTATVETGGPFGFQAPGGSSAFELLIVPGEEGSYNMRSGWESNPLPPDHKSDALTTVRR
ncbi:hypothetical protein ElyMa_003894200 [Elysia marginata]|uniref:Uncharacterized protein n=1 Tax=Elysia marginata TaxID=1093978 RepID=A0AAV4FQ28_9GAST|nr:hypothetical protein ElyMa_003894200 [Elysia marginata]